MNIRNFLVLLALSTIAAPSWAWRCPPDKPVCVPEDCPDGACVSWDFSKTPGENQTQTGDPLSTYTSTGSTDSKEYSLVIQGFTIGQYGGDHGDIYDGVEIATDDNDDYSSNLGIGVHANGENSHWSGKIDNYYNSGGNGQNTIKLRDAILMDFVDCAVSFDQIGLDQVNGVGFELWAYTGDPAGFSPVTDNLDSAIMDYSMWASNGWEQVDFAEQFDVNGSGDCCTTGVAGEDVVFTFDSDAKAQYYILVAGADQYAYNRDNFRMTSLGVNCATDADCGGGGPPTGVPVPGSLALLGIGALLGRKRLLKLA